MKLLEINSCCGCLSTGRIAADIAKEFLDENPSNQAVIAYARDYKECGIKTYKIGSKINVYAHKLYSMVLDGDGFGSHRATRAFVQWAEQYDPDVLWLHNIHGYYINIEILFDWIKSRPQMQVVWTLHDCWAFTGHCTNFTMSQCDKWKTGCLQCGFERDYPATAIGRSEDNYRRKRSAFTGVEKLKIVTPSMWLAKLVKESFLKEYPVEVRNNKIDQDVFKPTKSNFVEKYGLQRKKIILGVASTWSEKKGLSDFIGLSKLLNEDFQIVLVGVTKKQKRKLPQNILAIERTDSKEELAGIYSAADVFVNPTYEDNYPTTNLEARACGTPVITYNTGGSPESVEPENVVQVGNVAMLAHRIIQISSIGKRESNA